MVFAWHCMLGIVWFDVVWFGYTKYSAVPLVVVMWCSLVLFG